jgi:hypothetical protein
MTHMVAHEMGDNTMRIPLDHICEITADKTNMFILLMSQHTIKIPHDRSVSMYVHDGYEIYDDDNTGLHIYLTIE